MSEGQGEIIQWKRLWQLTSGIHYSTPNEAVRAQLEDVSKQLIDGLGQFQKGSSASEAKLKETLTRQKQEKLQKFTQRLHQFLCLDAIQAWDLLKYYLLNEYKGSASNLSSCISTESAMLKLLNDILSYYNLQRMVMLRIVKTMLEYQDSPHHPYAEEYRAVLTKMGIQKLRQSYIAQFEASVKEVPEKTVPGDLFNSHSKLVVLNERNVKEQVVLLQIIILCVEECGIEPADLKRLVDIFRLSFFGKQQSHLSPANLYHSELTQKLTNYEVAFLIRAFDGSKSVSESWVRDVITSVGPLIKTLYQSPEHGPILLCWMLLNFRLKESRIDDEAATQLRVFGVKAAGLGVFEFLHQLVRLADFSDGSKISDIVRRATFNHISFLCELFDSDVAQHAKIFDVVGELLRSRFAAGDMMRYDAPVQCLLNAAQEQFPFNFEALTKLGTALTAGDYNAFRWIQSSMVDLPIYAEVFEKESFEFLPTMEVDTFTLIHEYRPLTGVDFAIPKGTEFVVVDGKLGTTAHFRTKFNFFLALQHEMNELLRSSLHCERVYRVSIGLEYLTNVLKQIKSPDEIAGAIVHPTEMVFDLLLKFRGLSQPPVKLMTACLNVCTSLIPLVEHEIVSRIVNLSILPTLKNPQLNFRAFANGTGFDPGLVGTILVNVEKNLGKFEFLQAYFEFLQAHAKLCTDNIYIVELPGLVFLLREVFPHVNGWKFQSPQDKRQIFVFMLKHFFDILQPVSERSRQRQLLRQVCISSLLNLENGLTLLKFVAVGNPLLQSIMENESNWMNTSGSGVNYIVQLAMTVLMQILHFKKEIQEVDSPALTPLESTIFTQPKQVDTLRIIPVVTSYMSNIFNPRLPVLACRLLRRFALEFQMSLLACLDMEPDQIRLIFLHRLKDDLENPKLKEAILELVEACIQKQPGLTEAFFKNQEERKKSIFSDLHGAIKKPQSQEEGIVDYMKEYLYLISQDPASISSPILSLTTTLFYTLWKNNMQSLASELIEKDTFWPALCAPLFDGEVVKLKPYSQIFNILGIEVFRVNVGAKFNEKLKEVLERLLKPPALERWLNKVFNMPNHSETHAGDVPDWMSLLQSFKDLLVLLMRNKTLEISEASRDLLAKRTMDTLVSRISVFEDLRPLVVVAEFHLIILNTLKPQNIDNTQNIDYLLAFLAAYYKDVHVRAREALLSIVIKSLSPEFTSTDLQKLLESVVEIVSVELQDLNDFSRDTRVVQKRQEEPRHVSVQLALTLLRAITKQLEDSSSPGWFQCFKQTKILNRILSCLGSICQTHSRRKITTELLNLLVVLACGPCSRELLFSNIDEYLWMNLLPPKELLLIAALDEKPPKSGDSAREWKLKEWWPIYIKGIQLVTKLLQKHGQAFKKEAIFFLGIHEEFLLDSLLLVKHSLEPDAIDLIKITLGFLTELSGFSEFWRLEHQQSLHNLLKCTQILTHAAVSLLYRPRILKRLAEGPSDSSDEIPESAIIDSTDEIVNVMNELIEIISLCAQFLLSFSPKLLSLVCDPEFLPSQWPSLVEIQFGTPKLSSDGFPQLSFGSLMSAACIFTKALNYQHYSFQDTSLNALPSEDVDQVDMTVSLADSILPPTTPKSHSLAPTRATSLASSPKTPFSKSLSMTSVAGASEIAPSNELLSHLDAHKCISALELVLTLLASQSLLALKDTHLLQREKQMIRRELSTELLVFHDFVKKKICRDGRANYHRKKYGIFEIKNFDDNDDDNGDEMPQPTPIVKSSEHAKSLRVNLAKKLIQKQQTGPLETSLALSPIAKPKSAGAGRHLAESTPLKGILKAFSSPASKRQVTFDRESTIGKKLCSDEDEEILFDPIEPASTGLSHVKMVEEDYLHLLSIIFSVVCQTDN